MKAAHLPPQSQALTEINPIQAGGQQEVASPEQVAATFVKLCKEKSGTDPTNLKLQKLVYIANGYSLAIQNRPIHCDDTHAWTFGPVSKKLYESLKHHGRLGVTKINDISGCPVAPLAMGSREFKIVEAVFEEFGNLPAGKLVDITHKPGTPWEVTWRSNPYSVIENSLTRSYYKSVANN